jgi:tRNA-2-methylthio-N6-dimethylallyladenosine synthase
VTGRYYLQTFGCQMNVHDSDRMEEVLAQHGWTKAPDVEGADLVVFNTCSVREKAEQKLRSEVGKLAPLKRLRPELVVAVAGCVAQQEGERLLARVPHIDLVIGPDNLEELPVLALAQAQGASPVARTVFDLEAPHFLAARPVAGHAPASAFVTTMKGCDERCSFCIVPYTRGPERYRPASEIVAEVQRWVQAGSREVVLLGQTVDSYRDPALPAPASLGGERDASEADDETQFPVLLRLLAREVPGLARLRYTSPHPRHATAALARAHAELDVLCPHVHLPVQSGSDRMLRRMIRRYTRAEYVARTARLQAARPGLTLSTDIIVGFPGETEEDFQATLSLVAEVGFTSIFAFKFSPRPHTPALKLADDVPEGVKSERLARLFALSEAQQQAHLAGLVGTKQRVLVEGASRRGVVPEGDEGAAAGHGAASAAGAAVTGRTEGSDIVHVETEGRALVGEVVEVLVVQANKHSVVGRLTERALEALPRARSADGAPAKKTRALPVIA